MLLRILTLVTLLTISQNAFSEFSSPNFPVDAKMQKRVNFWKKVYTEISSHEAFIHDKDDINLIYKKINYERKSRRERRRIIRSAKNSTINTLRSIIKKNKNGLTDEEQNILTIIKDPPIQKIKELSRNIRYQQGMSNRYHEGLLRSLEYMDQIINIFKSKGLPEELAYLPHVESSFNYRAYSKVGAAGMWQFMRATARIYKLKLTYVVDERRDPIASTIAAANLLRDNYERLGTWPLALTAYNHGPVSIERAIKNVGTTDICKIIEEYDGKRFGFASKNFYATFMATVDISKNPEKYFGKLPKPKPHKYSEIVLNKSLTVRQIIKNTGLSEKDVKDYNPSLRPIAFKSYLYLPQYFKLKIPPTKMAVLEEYNTRIAKLKSEPPDIRAGGTHIVSRGETLDFISKIYKVTITDLIVLNKISNPTRIFPGTKIVIPSLSDKELIAKRANFTPPKPTIPEPTTPETATTIAENTFCPVDFSKLAQNDMEPEKDTENQSIFNSLNSFWSDSYLATQEEDIKNEELSQDTEVSPQVDSSSYNFDINRITNNVYSIHIETEETLGHYAEWADVDINRIRMLNRLGANQPIRILQVIKIPLDDNKLQDFNLKRVQYHMSIQEDFYSNYKLEGIDDYYVRRGDTIDVIIQKNGTPFWLLRKHQPENFSSNLSVGQLIKIPRVVPINPKE